jgi:hypothetical protein
MTSKVAIITGARRSWEAIPPSISRVARLRPCHLSLELERAPYHAAHTKEISDSESPTA